MYQVMVISSTTTTYIEMVDTTALEVTNYTIDVAYVKEAIKIKKCCTITSMKKVEGGQIRGQIYTHIQRANQFLKHCGKENYKRINNVKKGKFSLLEN